MKGSSVKSTKEKEREIQNIIAENYSVYICIHIDFKLISSFLPIFSLLTFGAPLTCNLTEVSKVPA